MARAHRGPRLIIRVVKNIYESASQQLSISIRIIDSHRLHHSFANLVYIYIADLWISFHAQHLTNAPENPVGLQQILLNLFIFPSLDIHIRKKNKKNHRHRHRHRFVCPRKAPIYRNVHSVAHAPAISSASACTSIPAQIPVSTTVTTVTPHPTSRTSFTSDFASTSHLHSHPHAHAHAHAHPHPDALQMLVLLLRRSALDVLVALKNCGSAPQNLTSIWPPHAAPIVSWVVVAAMGS